MPLDQRNSIMAKDTSLIFSLFDVSSAREVPFWHTKVHLMHSSGTFHCPPLCSIHLCWQWKALIWWLHVMASFAWREIICTFHSGYFYYRGAFLNSSWFVLLCNESNAADREGQWILQFQKITGVRGTIIFFIVATLITGILFKQFLIRTAV